MAQTRHINTIARRIRTVDREECEAMGRTPKQALRGGLMTSAKAWTVLVDGRPEAMFGVVVESVLTGEGTPWFLGTNAVHRHARHLLMWGPGMVQQLCDSPMTLRNLVSARNTRAIRLLKRWGFSVGSETIMHNGVPFLTFEKVAG